MCEGKEPVTAETEVSFGAEESARLIKRDFRPGKRERRRAEGGVPRCVRRGGACVYVYETWLGFCVSMERREFKKDK